MIGTGPLIALALVIWAIAIGAQRASRRAHRELDWLQAAHADPHATVLPPNALTLRLEPELQWAAATERPVGVTVFRFLGVVPDAAAQLLREHMRGGEVAYRLRLDEFAIAFWDTDRTASLAAIRRLGAALDTRAAQVVEVGLASFPEDGTTYNELITHARDRRTVLEFASADPEPASKLPAPLRPLALAVPGFTTVSALLIVMAHVCGRWFDWHTGHGWFARAAAAVVVSTLIGIAAAASMWLANGRTAPRLPIAHRSAPASPAWIALSGIGVGGALLLGLMWSWPVAVSIASLAVIVTGLLAARTLVHGNYAMLVLLAAVGIALVATTRTGSVDIANLGRLIIAAAGGCLIARALESWTWSAWLMGGASLLDIWSVFSEHGTTRELATVGSALVASATRTISDPLSLDDLLFSGPPINGTPAFAIGTSDLVLMMMCIATAHIWRLGTRSVAAALLVAAVGSIALSVLRGDIVPAIPCLTLAYTAVLIAQRRYRTRHSS